MTNKQNEIQVAAEQTHEMASFAPKLADNVYQTADGKFKRKAVYKEMASIVPETMEQKIRMAQLFAGDLKESEALGDLMEGNLIELKDVIIRKYDGVDEETGEIKDGVIIYLFTQDDRIIVTNSKPVYFKLTQNVFPAFGEPSYTADEAPKLEVYKEKANTGRKYNALRIVL